MFVGRNFDGSIYGVWTCPQPQDAEHPRIEELPDTHQDIVDFQNRQATAVESLDSRVAALETRMTATELTVSDVSLTKIG